MNKWLCALDIGTFSCTTIKGRWKAVGDGATRGVPVADVKCINTAIIVTLNVSKLCVSFNKNFYMS